MSIKLTPLNEAQESALKTLVGEAGSEQLNWLSGYFHGLVSGLSFNSDSSVLSPSINPPVGQGQTAKPAATTAVNVTILYGSHTGRSEGLAKKLAEKLGSQAATVKVAAMDDYNPKDLAKEENVLLIVSTHGEGEPPEMAEDFHSFMLGKRAPKLPNLNYSVLALGDKSYKLFCQTGTDFDNALAKAGATAIAPVVMCDVDYEDDAAAWIDSVSAKLKVTQSVLDIPAADTDAPSASVSYDKKNPFKAAVIDKAKITGDDSDKEVYHVELDLADSGITYEPGDSLAILADNPPALVTQIITTLKADADTKVTLKDGEFSLENALRHQLEITLLTRDVIQKYADKTKDKALAKVLANEALLDEYLWGHDVLDLLVEFPAKLTPQDLVDLLRPLPPRLYSISSSQEAVGEEVHITVATVRYENKDRERQGAASTYLADRINIDDEVPIFIQKNPGFRLPENADTPIIMVGAGTGIAPFRAFIQQSEADNRSGQSWLFFGERRFYSDFLYQIEWQKYLKKGVLDKIELAFSRDQAEKIYVQDRLLEQQEELFNWLENGAAFYLCGDMKYMAKDVQKTLFDIVQSQGKFDEAQTQDYIKKLKKEKRLQLDVY